MSQQYMQSSPIQLIANPKSRKDWENNKLYYRNKAFSKRQLEIMDHEKKVVAHCLRVMSERSHGDGGSNPLNGGYCPPIKKKKVHKPVAVTDNTTPSNTDKLPPVTDTEEIKSRILAISLSLNDEWDTDA
jgi:hypothetical protein